MIDLRVIRLIQGRWERASALSEAEAGNAIVEFVFVAVLVMIPLVYLIVAVAVAQASSAAVSQAARDAGRAFATADTVAQADARAQVAVRLALASENLPNDATLSAVAAGAPCGSAAVTPSLDPAAVFTFCVTRQTRLPAIPTVLAGRGISAVGRFTVHVDDYRSGS